jgi:hypothetical protein
MKLAERTNALMAVVEDHRRKRCVALLEPAHEEAHTQLIAVLDDAHRRVRTALAEERARLNAEVGAAEAALATERRLVAQRQAAHTLERGWRQLRDLLIKRWLDPLQRQRWVTSQLLRAADALAGRGDTWQVAYEAAWTESERAAVQHAFSRRGVKLQCEPRRTLVAGLIVTCGHNVLDASLDGLLADRLAIEGRLLQLMQDRQ